VLGVGVLGLGLGVPPQTPNPQTPNPQSPIPNPQGNFKSMIINYI